MSDTSAPLETPSPGGEGPPAAPPSGDAPPPEPSAQDVPTDPAELSALVGKLRDENVRYKERFRPWEQSVGTLHPDDSRFILSFVDAIYSGDEERAVQAVGQMRAALDELSPAEQREVKQAIAAASPEAEFDPYDPKNIDERVKAQLEAAFAERDQQAERARLVDKAGVEMQERAKALAEQYGIPEMGDARTTLGRQLYIEANNNFPSERDPMVRLDLAAQVMSEDLHKAAQRLLQAKTADASPSPVPADAVEPSGVQKPKTMSDAKRSADAHIEKLMAGEVGT